MLPLLISAIASLPQLQNTQQGFNSLKNFTQTSVTSKVIGSISILLGLVIAFFGYRLLDMILGISGFIVFGDLAYFILVRFEPVEGYGDGRGWILLLVPITAGIIGAIVAYSIFRLGLGIVGFLGGASLAILILSFGTNGLIDNDLSRLIFILVLGIFMAIVIQFAEKFVVVFATSIAGSLAVFMGLDAFIQTGFNQVTQLFLFRGVGIEGIRYQVTSQVGWMIGATILLSFISGGYQYKYGRYHK
jgi:hypothetical protein